MIPSLQIPTYDLQPEMRTHEIGEATVDLISKGAHEFIVVNFAGPDMVGHTGDTKATIAAIEAMDLEFGHIYNACNTHQYTLLITSDHGNSEQMLSNGNPHTAHTTNKVPFLITKNTKLTMEGGLENIAPTILDLLNIDKPSIMRGTTLIGD
jgi:2,3-bisphosphoglycerate-independent phosphoglycerate mutase